MGILMSTNWRTYSVPLTAGVQTKYDPRALPVQALAVCRNAQFDELGGVQKRKPFASIGTNILGGGTISDCRRIVEHGDELLLFTKTALYSWSVRDSAWVLKATYLAAKVDESSAFVRTSEQTLCDRAELLGVTFYAWLDTSAATAVYVAALDTETGAVLLAPTAMAASTTRPRLLVMSTKVLFFFVDGTNLKGLVLDPASLATTVAATPTTVSAVNSYYDVVKVGSNACIAMRQNPTTSYAVLYVTEALAAGTSVTPARVCDGPIAVAASPANDFVAILRGNTTNVQGDLLAVTGLTDNTINKAVGTATGTINQIAACFRTVQNSGTYRCYTFWSSNQATTASTFVSKFNYMTAAGTLGTQANFVPRLGIVSRAFDHNGSVYVWGGFASESSFSGAGTPGLRGQLQNTYFLYRDDAFLVAKAAADRAGGFVTVTGCLPNVQNTATNVYSWSGLERRIIPLGGNKNGYSARVPLGITIEFDSNEARRTARLGRTLYVTGGEIMQYDGAGLFEVGFHIYPFYFAAIEVVSTGSIAAGVYTLKNTLRWDNAVGDRDRSTTATTGDVTVTAGNSLQIVTWYPLNYTHKTGTGTTPCEEMWRTLKNPPIEAPFFLVTSNDPATVTGQNCYVPNSHTATALANWEDGMIDATASTKEANPENGGVLESLAPPPATIIIATQDRLFLAGIANNPYQVCYSKLRGGGEVAAFHDALTIDLPPDGGPITALAILDETLVVFKETAIYTLPGEGFDNAEGGQNYGPARRLSADVGAVSAEAVALTPQGLVFKSNKGWRVVTRGGGVEYIGAAVAAFDSDTVVAVHVVETQHQLRCLTTSRMLVFDYEVGAWSEWTVADGLDATIWGGTYTYLATASVKAEQTTYSAVNYSLDLETAWIKLSDLQGFQRVSQAMVLGEYRSAHDLRIRVAYNYGESDAVGITWVDDRYWTVTPTTVGGPEQVRFGPGRPKGQAIKFRITDYAVGSTTTAPAGEGLRLTGLSLKVGVEPGLYRGLAAAQKE